EFEKQKLTVAVIVNPLDTFQVENCSVVITNPSHKYVKASDINKSGMFRIRAFNAEHTCSLKDRVAKKRALISLRETPWGSYNKLPDYLYILDITYPGSHLRLKKMNEDRFVYLFVALDPFIKGFDHCRPVVVVDGSHLRGPYNGTFIAASTKYGAKEVRLMFDKWNCDNKKEASFTFTPLIGKFQEILKINEAISTRLMARNYIVCLPKKRCTCGSFSYEEIPCEHAWAVLKFNSLRPDEFCSNLYTPKTVLKTYDFPIYPLPDKTEWVVLGYIMTDLVLPPIFKRPRRRSRKKSRNKLAKEMFDSKGTNTYNTCGVASHNRHSCRNQPWGV
ncbi:hypothetical protein H5410_021109, partial [Solanum commersonii]